MNFEKLNKDTRYQPYIENIKKYISLEKKNTGCRRKS